jgi:hypothetical protein
MPLYQYVFFLFGIVWLSIHAFPNQVLSLVAELKRRLRMFTIDHSGRQMAHVFERQFHHRIFDSNYDPQLVETILLEHRGVVANRLGRKAAEDILGGPSTAEQFY